MRSKVLFLDHVGALGGAELALMDVARTYRDTSTFLLFADGPFRERLTNLGINVEVIEGGDALHSVRRETAWPGITAAMQVMALAWRTARLARRHDFLHANSQKAFVMHGATTSCMRIPRRPSSSPASRDCWPGSRWSGISMTCCCRPTSAAATSGSMSGWRTTSRSA